MNPSLFELGLQLSRSESITEFRQSIEQGVDALGGSLYSAMACNTDAHGHEPVFMIHNMPTAYLASFTDISASKRDPVMQHCRLSSTPIVWDRSTYERVGQREEWEHMADHGLLRGASLALHLERQRHFVFGIEWDRQTTFRPEEKASLAADLQLLTLFAEPVAYRLSQVERGTTTTLENPLSPRELECMQWVSRGMTDDLIARILSISARTVRKHVDNSVSKLGAANRTEAAVTAIRRGYLP